jgi:predicted acetyltransferase
MDDIRQLTEEEMLLSRELIDFAFKREGSREEPLVICRPGETWGCFVDNELASNIVIKPELIFIQGESMKMGLIAGVASWPEYRKAGTIGKLMLRSLQVMRESGQPVSYLGPFSYPFYRKYGWEMMYDYKMYTVPASAVPVWSGEGRTKRIGPDVSRLNAVYESYAKRYNGMMNRDERRWQTSVFKNKEGFIAIYTNLNGQDTGYLIYRYTGQQLTVHEMVYLDSDSQRGLWEFIRKQDSMYHTVVFRAPADDPFPFLIDNPKGLDTSCRAHMMARIVVVAKFLEGYRFNRGFGGVRFRMNITDEHADWNNGTFEVSVGDDGLASVSKGDREPLSASRGEVLVCDIRTLSTMMMGYQSPHFLWELDRLAGSESLVNMLEKLLPKRFPYYMDTGH